MAKIFPSACNFQVHLVWARFVVKHAHESPLHHSSEIPPSFSLHPDPMDPTYPLVPIANFLACVLVVIPLAHMLTRPWNTGVYFFALWTLLSSLSTAINTLVWSNDVKDRAPIWCDICKSPIYFSSLSPTEIWLEASHIDILVNTGIPACSLSITRRLYKITTIKGAMINRRQVTVSSSTAATEC